MPAVAVVGTQWGDEGKGKVTDLLARDASIVVRTNGGSNSGHTVVVDGDAFKLQLLPAGVLSSTATPVLGDGMVIDLFALRGEVEALAERGVDVSRMLVSRNAHVVTKIHQAVDRGRERRLGDAALGTTGRGIGPAYADKVARRGLRVQDLFGGADLVGRRVAESLALQELSSASWEGAGVAADLADLVDELLSLGRWIEPFVADTSLVINDALDRGEVVLLEGGQASMLDVDHGTYPFVTSSSTTAAGACGGAGIGPTRLAASLGVVKAYTTRVGAGPFVTEQDNAAGRQLRERGGEFGVNTGRPRRCGWFDAVAMRHAVRINDLSALFLTKLDVLTGLSEIPVCVAYEVDGEVMESMPATAALERTTPIYDYLPGWDEDISGARSFDELPAPARRLVTRIEQLAQCPINYVGVGPDRTANVIIDEFLAGPPQARPGRARVGED